jgi:hypothetical protein
MRAAKIYVLDEFEEIRRECERPPSQHPIYLSEHDILLKQQSPKKITPRMEIDPSSLLERTITPKKIKSFESFEITGRKTDQFSLQKFCRSYVSSTIINEERIQQVVCKILGISYHHLLIQNIATILRDHDCTSSLISDTFDPNHIKLSNPAKLYASLESRFGPTKSTTLSLHKTRSRLLSISKLKITESKRTSPGLVILLHPATTTLQQKYQLKLRYRSAITKEFCVESIVFWGNGNLYSNHMTTIHNLPHYYAASDDSDVKHERNRRLSTLPLGGNLQEHSKNSLPGYNGRIPIWIPCYECEISLEEHVTDCAPETEVENDPHSAFHLLTPTTPIKANQSRDQDQIFLNHDSFDFTPERNRGGPREKYLSRLYSSQSCNSLFDDHPTFNQKIGQRPSTSTTSRSRWAHPNTSPLLSTPYINPALPSSHHQTLAPSSPPQSPSRPMETPFLTSSNSQQLVIHFKYFACSSLELTLSHLASITFRCQQHAIASLTLPGNVPALNTACLYGNLQVGLLPLHLTFSPSQAVKKFLEYGADPNRICGSTYSTPLHDAVLGGHCEIIKLLLSKGALQVLVDENRWTPLHLACWKNDILSIRSLLVDRKHACEALRMKDRHGQTPNHLCKRRIGKDVIESMLVPLPNLFTHSPTHFPFLEFMTDHNIPIKKATWWNTLSNSFRVRVDGKERDHKDAIKEYVIKARMKGQAPKDSDYY